MATVETNAAPIPEAKSFAPERPKMGVVFWTSVSWILLVIAAAVLADLLPLRDPDALGIRTGEIQRFESPGVNAWFGGDGQGRDLFAQIVHGARPAMVLSAAVTLIGGSLGVLIGVVAGYVRGRTDAVIMGIAEIMFAFPAIVLLFAVGAIWGITMAILIPVMAVLAVPSYARIVRGVTIAVAERDFVDAARAMGASQSRVVIKELLPLVALPAIAFGFLGFGLVIATEGALAFLGLGLEQRTWGSLIAGGQGLIREAPHLALIPATAMFLTIMAFNYVGDGVRELIDPRPIVVGRKRRADGPRPTTASASDALLSIRDLRTSFPTPGGVVTAVDGVSLDVRTGRTLGVVGESGSGKTMLLRSITGAFPVVGVQREGRVVVDGTDLLSASPASRSAMLGNEIGVISQNPLSALNPVRTVGSQLVEVMRVHRAISKAAARARAIELLEQVGIPRPGRRVDMYPHQLSGGMQQRVTIAIALANEPRLLLADEPTTALDVTIQDQILRLLASLGDEYNMAVVLVTHDLSVVRGWADDVAVMYGGQIVESGPTSAVFGDPQHRYTQALLESTPRLDLPIHSRLAAIEGQPPSLVAPPAGCRFADRCAGADERCRSEVPVLERLGSVEFRCWHPGQGEAR
ncbi:MAG: dipeptide/oligopeptide/nickel ABC transporter permease/ATP-binding protein [Acidimicrobiales bacterium]|nr:dipeptide/oligopeptide/nickel ABC transporter permease/ATP-binding protein [Acidimicrobiales bacterium]